MFFLLKNLAGYKNLFNFAASKVLCSLRLVRPRTPGFHPGNRGSNPLGSTQTATYWRFFFAVLLVKSNEQHG